MQGKRTLLNPVPSVPFQPVLEAARILADLNTPWYAAGGWAIDLYLQQPRRNHKDVDIAVFRRDQLTVQNYFTDMGWQLRKYVGDSGALEQLEVGEQLELPDRGILAEPSEPVGQGLSSIDILLSETDGEQWWYHADPRITHPVQTVGLLSSLGVPILSPEIVLLFKARHLYVADPESLLHRQADDSDFRAIQGSLLAQHRSWLEQALALLYPGHPWLEQLGRP